MSKMLGAAALALVLLLAAAYAGSPLLAFQQLKAAARLGDRERLEALVDFPSVRDSLKRQVDSKAVKAARTASGIGYLPAMVLGKLGAAIGDRAVDRLVTPDAISIMAVFGRVPRAGDRIEQTNLKTVAADEAGAPRRVAARTSFAYLTPDRFRVRVIPAEAPDKPIALIMDRRGLFSWRVEEIELPK